MVQGLIQIFRVNLTVNVHISKFLRRLLWGRIALVFDHLYLLIGVRELSDVLQNDVKNSRFKKLVKLLAHLLEIADWAVENTKAFLNLTEDFGEVLDPLLVRLSIVGRHTHAYVGHQWEHMGIKITLTCTMPGYFLHDPEDSLLSSKLEEVHLLQNNTDSAGLEDCWRVLHRNLFVGLDTRL